MRAPLRSGKSVSNPLWANSKRIPMKSWPVRSLLAGELCAGGAEGCPDGVPAGLTATQQNNAELRFEASAPQPCQRMAVAGARRSARSHGKHSELVERHEHPPPDRLRRAMH